MDWNTHTYQLPHMGRMLETVLHERDMDASDLAQLANISKQYARGLLRARVLNLGILAKVSIALDTNLIMEIALSLPLEEPPCPPNR